LATPILLLTARGQIVDKVAGLKLGADDYVTKPFDTLELMARIEALLRRAPTRTGQGILHFGSIHVDIRGTQVTREGKPVYLSAREFQLLRYFTEHKGITLSRDEILREVWGYEVGTFTRTVDVHVAGLRQKLEKAPKKPEMIITVPGIGYKFQG
jgi:two-component system alkaline phosphatase synthesis response regulator PhoP